MSSHVWGQFMLLAKAPQQSATSSCSLLTAFHSGKVMGRWLSQGQLGKEPCPLSPLQRCPTEKPFSWRDLDGYVHAPLYVADANNHSITRQRKMPEHHFVRSTVSHLYQFQNDTKDHSTKLKSKPTGWRNPPLDVYFSAHSPHLVPLFE